MAERQKKSKQRSKTDPKYLARREKNRIAVTKHRLKKALEDGEREARKEKLRLENAKLEGKVHQLKVTKQLLKELLIEQLRRRGQRLTMEQMKCINDDFDADDIEIEEEEEKEPEYDDESTSEESLGGSESEFEYRG